MLKLRFTWLKNSLPKCLFLHKNSVVVELARVRHFAYVLRRIFHCGSLNYGDFLPLFGHSSVSHNVKFTIGIKYYDYALEPLPTSRTTVSSFTVLTFDDTILRSHTMLLTISFLRLASSLYELTCSIIVEILFKGYCTPGPYFWRLCEFSRKKNKA